MDRWRCVMTTCWCGAPYSGLHKHFCPVARTEPDLEYATKGTTARLVEAEAAIQRARELCERSRVAMSRGCTCYTNECSGCGYGTPLAWDLDPVEVLAVLDEICT